MLSLNSNPVLLGRACVVVEVCDGDAASAVAHAVQYTARTYTNAPYAVS